MSTPKIIENRELMKEWDDDTVNPYEVSSGSHKKVWWKCEKGHRWDAVIKNRVYGSGCPYCSGNKVLEGYNDLAFLYPHLKQEWSEKNYPLVPEKVAANSNKQVLWKCHNNHEWKARIADRVKEHGCPYCSGKLLVGFNDFATENPDIALEWSDRNEDKPQDYLSKSRKMVWWKCLRCNCEYEAVIYTRVTSNPCPGCRLIRKQNNYIDFLIRKREKTRLKHELPLDLAQEYLNEKGIRTIRNEQEIIGLPIALYLPDYLVAFEFSEMYRKVDNWEKKEFIKNELCRKAKIRMIRIHEPGINPFDNCLCINKEDETIETLRESIERAIAFFI